MAGNWFVPRVEKVSRGKGDAPATAKAAYRSGECILDARTGETHDYTRKTGIEAKFIMAPENVPAWAQDRARLWNAAEQTDNRKNSVTARELVLPLPAEIDAATRREVAESVARFLVERYGVAVDVSLHLPHREGDERNHHAHILFTTRRMGRDGLAEKTRELDDKEQGPKEIEAIREAAANATNRALERAGVSYRVDHRSYERRGIDREAGRHMGPKAVSMERRGKRTEVGDFNRAVQASNRRRETLTARAKVIDLAIVREERRRAEAAALAQWRKARVAAAFADRQAKTTAMVERHMAERKALLAGKEQRIEQRKQALAAKYKPHWAALFHQQRHDMERLKEAERSVMGRLRFFVKNKEALHIEDPAQRRGSLAAAFNLVIKQKAMEQALERKHSAAQERLANAVKEQIREIYAKENETYRAHREALKERQAEERRGLQAEHSAESQELAQEIATGTDVQNFRQQQEQERTEESSFHTSEDFLRAVMQEAQRAMARDEQARDRGGGRERDFG